MRQFVTKDTFSRLYRPLNDINAHGNTRIMAKKSFMFLQKTKSSGSENFGQASGVRKLTYSNP